MASTGSRKAAPAGTQSIQRALLLLREVARSHRALTLAELGRRLELTPPTAHRMLGALEATGLVERDHTGLAYRLGDEVRSWATVALESQLRAAATSPLLARQLAAWESGEWREWGGVLCPTAYLETPDAEYRAIRDRAALIDISPLAVTEIVGPEAGELANILFTRDLRAVRIGEVVYSCWCDERGKVLQLGHVARLARDRFRVTSAQSAHSWLERWARGLDAEVRELSGELALLALQGPRSPAVLAAATGGTIDPARLRYLHVAAGEIGGVAVIVARTGLTGDLGYELTLPAIEAGRVWDALTAAGEPHELRPVGLAALDATRIEAGWPLIGVDLFDAGRALLPERRSTPYEAGLGWTVELRDGHHFVGRAALEPAASRPPRRAVVGVEVGLAEIERDAALSGDDRQLASVSPSHRPAAVHAGGRPVGRVTSQVFSPWLGRQIGLATVERAYRAPGSRVELEILEAARPGRAAATVASLPFYDPPHRRADLSAVPQAPAAALDR